MGFFDKVKTFFDAGGLDTELRAPDEFRWSDESIPLRLRITGHETEPRTVESIAFELRPAERDAGSVQARRAARDGLRFEWSEPFTLAPGEQRELVVDFPLKALDSEGGLSWVEGAVGALMGGKALSFGLSEFTISATPSVAGKRVSRGTNRRIFVAGRSRV